MRQRRVTAGATIRILAGSPIVVNHRLLDRLTAATEHRSAGLEARPGRACSDLARG